jgi:kynurenine formamidase
MLVNGREMRAVGLDIPSLDHGRSTLFETHQGWGPRAVEHRVRSPDDAGTTSGEV